MMRRSISTLCAIAAWCVGCGMVAQGAVRADDGPQTVLRVDFTADEPTKIVAPDHAATAVLTSDPVETLGGKRALKGDSRTSTAEWNEFFHSRTGIFKPHTAYRIGFDYRVLARDENAKFYALLRRAGSSGGNDGWTEWQGRPGDRGHIEVSYVVRNATDYTLIIGIQHQGALAIDHIVIRATPALPLPDIRLPAPKRTWISPGYTTYYLDSAHGNDSNDGMISVHAWRSLQRVNSGTFAPGDHILLRSGSSWSGYLAPGGSGKAGTPITLGRYGEGAKPRIDAEGRYLATLWLHNVEYWEVSDLDIVNQGKVRQPNLAGVQVSLQDFGTAHSIHLRNLDVHDVTGSLVKDEGGGNGISCTNGGDRIKSVYDDLLIEGCHLWRTDRNGITMSGYWSRSDWHPNLHVVIRKNVLEDIGGDGIVPIGCDGARVEENLLRGGRQRCDDYAAGIWPWSCDNTTIQHNEVSGMKGTRDGQGYDSDWNCRNTLFQYNYSHDNEGGFMLICNNGDSKMPWSIGNLGTIIRYNISQNDGERTFQITGPCRDTQIYNNVFYVGKGRHLYAVQAGNWGGDWSENTRFWNNIFAYEGQARFDFGGMRATVFNYNVFWGDLQDAPADPHAVTVDPKLIAPGTGGNGFASLSGYRLTADSPCLRAGLRIENNGRRDFWGNTIPTAVAPDIGAEQRQP